MMKQAKGAKCGASMRVLQVHIFHFAIVRPMALSLRSARPVRKGLSSFASGHDRARSTALSDPLEAYFHILCCKFTSAKQ